MTFKAAVCAASSRSARAPCPAEGESQSYQRGGHQSRAPRGTGGGGGVVEGAAAAAAVAGDAESGAAAWRT